MNKIRHKYMIQSEINMVPFLDVLLVLLVIFMMIPSKFIQGFEVNLPNSTETIRTIDHNKPVLIIEIIKTGSYNIILNDDFIKDLYLDQLCLEIRKKINMNPNIICLLAASKHIQYDEVIKVLNLLSNIGIHSIGMITNPALSLS